MPEQFDPMIAAMMSPNQQSIPNLYDMQRKQMLAQMLMGQMQNSGNAPANWDSMRQVPKLSPLSGLTKLASGYLAGRGFHNSQQAAQNFYGGLMQPQGQGQSYQAPMPGVSKLDGQGDFAPTPTGQPQSQGMPQGTQDGQAMSQLRVINPQEYLKLKGQSEIGTPEWQNALKVTGGDPNGARELLAGKMLKDRTMELREGGMALDPVSGRVIGTNPKDGQMPVFDAQGRLVGYQMANGYIQNSADLAGAVAGAKERQKQEFVPNPFSPGSGSWTSPQGGGNAPPQYGQQSPPTYFRDRGAATPSISGHSETQVPPGMGNIPRMPRPSSGTPFDLELQKQYATRHMELSAKYGNDADTADQIMNFNREARAGLPNAEVGPLSHWLTENRTGLREILPGSLKDTIPEDGSITATPVVNKNLLNAALQGARQTYGSRMTQTEVLLQANQMSPSITTTPQAIKSLLLQSDARQAYAKQRAQDYALYAQHGGDPTRFESWYASKFPLQKFAVSYANTHAKEYGVGAPQAPQSPGAAPPVANTALDEAMKRHLGVTQ